jgi:ABC-2 type transport system permease protein
VKKYLLILKISFLSFVSYRISLVIRAIRDVLVTMFFITIWIAMFKQKEMVGGYTLSSMITYYIIARIIDQLYTLEPSKVLADDVVAGGLSTHLVKPYQYLGYMWGRAVGRRLARTLPSLILVMLVFIFFSRFLVFPSTWLYLCLFLISVALAWVLMFEIAIFVGETAFWLSKITGINSAINQTILLLGGMWAPINLFPPIFQKIMSYLPFQYLYFHPIQIYQGKISVSPALHGMAIESVWILVLGIVIVILWKRGLKRYEAFGN